MIDAPPARRPLPGCSISFLHSRWKEYSETGTFSMVRDQLERAPVRGDDVVADGQAEARPAFLGAEERLEDAGLLLARDPPARVLEQHLHPCAARTCRDAQAAAGGHGIVGVQDQVAEY